MAVTGRSTFFELLMIIRFGIVGMLATMTHIIIVWLLIDYTATQPLLANLLAFLVAFGVSFTGHYYWTFCSRANKKQAVRRFFLISGSAFLVNNVVLVTLLEQSGIAPLPATISAVFIIPVITYILGRFWAFQE